MKEIESSVSIAATKIADDVKADCIISMENNLKESFEESTEINVKVVIFKKVKEGLYSKEEFNSKARKVIGGSISPIKELIMEAINRKYIKQGERIVCVVNAGMGTGYKGLLFVLDIDNIFFDISTKNLTDNINSDVLESVINIALELSREGREGKRIGTAFIISDTEKISNYTKQMVINPFSNNIERNITDPSMKETIKNFAQLDGVFIINNNGNIISAGTYLDVDISDISLEGYGTKHKCCAAITNKIDALSIVVSESGGRIKIFKNGETVMNLP